MQQITQRSEEIKMDYKPTRILQPALAKKMVHHRFTSLSEVAAQFCIKTCKIDRKEPSYSIANSVDKLEWLGQGTSQGMDLLVHLRRAVEKLNTAEAAEAVELIGQFEHSVPLAAKQHTQIIKP
ncbi:hypothetical protein HDU77_009743 [Chytriomyces hyalinus]|nr:hypothetical protein HDU77_009743 [Chytriomyces hyalinus]